MTKTELEVILARWARVLRLENWNITIPWDMPCDPGIYAEIKISADYEQASMRIQQATDPDTDPPTVPFWEWDERLTNCILVHELLHIFENPVRRTVEAAELAMPKSAFDIFNDWYVHGAENWVDRLSIILVDNCKEGTE